ncbi:MAG TPA: hypothetical protein VMB76_02745 [Casimicrobiaceae bacterium]|jgi:hypothetical protein|nr:hypothetical protein [Casimicrobiaceae bacterium]
MMARSIALGVVPMLLVTAAHANSLKQDQQKVRSWSATAHMVAQAWVVHQMPRGYVARTLKAAQEGVRDTARELSAHASAVDARAALRDLATELDASLTAARAAAAHDDRAAMAPVVERLEATSKALARLP